MSARHMVVAIAGGFVAGAALLGVLCALNRGTGFAFCTATSGLGWTVPLVAGFVIGLTAIALLRVSLPSDEGSAGSLGTSACPSCGGLVIESSRLCPDCGEVLDRGASHSIGGGSSG